MSTWEIEHFSTTDGSGAGDRRTITAWGFAALDLELRNWSRGELILTLASGTAFTANPLFAFEDKIVVWRDNVRVWHGWHITPARELTVPAESIQYRFADAWYWLDKLTYDPDNWVVGDVTYETRSVVRPDETTFEWQAMTGYNTTLPGGEVVFTPWDDASELTVQGQIRRAVKSAIDQGAPFALGTVSVDMPAPDQQEKNLTCAARVQSASRYVPYSAGWWDQSQSVPVFHCVGRADLPAYSHSLGSPTEAAGITPLYDQQCHSVLIRYRWGEGQLDYYDDLAEEAVHPPRSRALVIHVDSPSQDAADKADYLGLAAKLLPPLYPLAWSGRLDLHEVGTALPWYLPGSALSLTGGRTEWETMGAIVQSVSHRVSAETTDTCSIELGMPQHLGVQDWLELSESAYESADAVSYSDTGGQEPPPRPPVPTPDPVPGTLRDLNEPLGLGGTPGGSIPIQVRGGAWSMSGFSSLNDTEPARRWATKTIAGSTVSRGWGDEDPSGVYILTTETFSGTFSINPSTGVGSGEWTRHHAYVYTDNTTGSADATFGVESDSFIGYVLPTVLNQGEKVTQVRGLTNVTLTSNTYTTGAYWVVDSASAAITLGTELSAESASATMLAAAEWGDGSGATAIRTVPTTSPSGIRRTLRYRTQHTEPIIERQFIAGHFVEGVWVDGVWVDVTVGSTTELTLTNLARNQRYHIRIDTERRAVNSAGSFVGDWEPGETINGPAFFSGMEGKGGHDWAPEIEAPDGYEVRIALITPEPY